MALTDAIVDTAIAEWQFFGKQQYDVDQKTIKTGKKETEPGYWQRVGKYWKEGCNKDWDGLTDQPWSAAFISYTMKTAGAGNKFKYAPAHSTYIYWAIRNKLDNKPAKFLGHRLSDYKPKPGDLLAHARQEGVDYDYASKNDAYISHCDVVVGREDGLIHVIGGNVGDSVTWKTLNLGANGKLTDKHYKWFAILENLL